MADDLPPPPPQELNEYRVLQLLNENPTASQRAIAHDLNISLGAVNYSLRALVERGLVKAQNFRNSKNKVAYVYLLTPSGIAQKGAMAAKFLAIKLREYEQLKREIDAARKDVGEAPDDGSNKSVSDGGAAP